MAQNGKLVPNLSQQSTWELNLTVLQRMDPQVEDILITAGHVTLYEFDVDLGQWSRKDVEGSLFVVKRKTKPRFQFIVMNRRSTENLVEDLLDDFEYEVQVPYLLYRNAAQEVNGIWFYNSRECDEVAKLFSRLLSAYAKVPPKAKVFTAQSNEFQELEAVPTAATVDGPLEPTSTPVSAVETPEDPLERFFNNALHVNTSEFTPSSISHPIGSIHSVLHRPSESSSTLTPLFTAPPPLSSSKNQRDSDIGSTNPGVLLKPSFFANPSFSSSPLPTLISPSLQPSLGAPLLQPFPPPVPSPSLTPASAFSSHVPVLNKEKIRDALYRLIQNDQFIDMVYQEMAKAQRTSI